MSVFPISLFLSFFKTFFLPFLNLYLQFCVFEFLSNFWISSFACIVLYSQGKRDFSRKKNCLNKG